MVRPILWHLCFHRFLELRSRPLLLLLELLILLFDCLYILRFLSFYPLSPNELGTLVERDKENLSSDNGFKFVLLLKELVGALSEKVVYDFANFFVSSQCFCNNQLAFFFRDLLGSGFIKPVQHGSQSPSCLLILGIFGILLYCFGHHQHHDPWQPRIVVSLAPPSHHFVCLAYSY